MPENRKGRGYVSHAPDLKRLTTQETDATKALRSLKARPTVQPPKPPAKKPVVRPDDNAAKVVSIADQQERQVEQHDASDAIVTARKDARTIERQREAPTVPDVETGHGQTTQSVPAQVERIRQREVHGELDPHDAASIHRYVTDPSSFKRTAVDKTPGRAPHAGSLPNSKARFTVRRAAELEARGIELPIRTQRIVAKAAEKLLDEEIALEAHPGGHPTNPLQRLTPSELDTGIKAKDALDPVARLHQATAGIPEVREAEAIANARDRASHEQASIEDVGPHLDEQLTQGLPAAAFTSAEHGIDAVLGTLTGREERRTTGQKGHAALAGLASLQAAGVPGVGVDDAVRDYVRQLAEATPFQPVPPAELQRLSAIPGRETPEFERQVQEAARAKGLQIPPSANYVQKLWALYAPANHGVGDWVADAAINAVPGAAAGFASLPVTAYRVGQAIKAGDGDTLKGLASELGSSLVEPVTHPGRFIDRSRYSPLDLAALGVGGARVLSHLGGAATGAGGLRELELPHGGQTIAPDGTATRGIEKLGLAPYSKGIVGYATEKLQDRLMRHAAAAPPGDRSWRTRVGRLILDGPRQAGTRAPKFLVGGGKRPEAAARRVAAVTARAHRLAANDSRQILAGYARAGVSDQRRMELLHTEGAGHTPESGIAAVTRDMHLAIQDARARVERLTEVEGQLEGAREQMGALRHEMQTRTLTDAEHEAARIQHDRTADDIDQLSVEHRALLTWLQAHGVTDRNGLDFSTREMEDWLAQRAELYRQAGTRPPTEAELEALRNHARIALRAEKVLVTAQEHAKALRGADEDLHQDFLSPQALVRSTYMDVAHVVADPPEPYTAAGGAEPPAHGPEGPGGKNPPMDTPPEPTPPDDLPDDFRRAEAMHEAGFDDEATGIDAHIKGDPQGLGHIIDDTVTHEMEHGDVTPLNTQPGVPWDDAAIDEHNAIGALPETPDDNYLVWDGDQLLSMHDDPESAALEAADNEGAHVEHVPDGVVEPLERGYASVGQWLMGHAEELQHAVESGDVDEATARHQIDWYTQVLDTIGSQVDHARARHEAIISQAHDDLHHMTGPEDMRGHPSPDTLQAFEQRSHELADHSAGELADDIEVLYERLADAGDSDTGHQISEILGRYADELETRGMPSDDLRNPGVPEGHVPEEDVPFDGGEPPANGEPPAEPPPGPDGGGDGEESIGALARRWLTLEEADRRLRESERDELRKRNEQGLPRDTAATVDEIAAQRAPLRAEADRAMLEFRRRWRAERGLPAPAEGWERDEFDPLYRAKVLDPTQAVGSPTFLTANVKEAGASGRSKVSEGYAGQLGRFDPHPIIPILSVIDAYSRAAEMNAIHVALDSGFVVNGLKDGHRVTYNPDTHALIPLSHYAATEIDPVTTPLRKLRAGSPAHETEARFRHSMTGHALVPPDGAFAVVPHAVRDAISDVILEHPPMPLAELSAATTRALNAFRLTQLLLRPGYLVNNAVGNALMAFTGGANPADLLWAVRHHHEVSDTITGGGFATNMTDRMVSGRASGVRGDTTAGSAFETDRSNALFRLFSSALERDDEGRIVNQRIKPHQAIGALGRLIANSIRDGNVWSERVSRAALFKHLVDDKGAAEIVNATEHVSVTAEDLWRHVSRGVDAGDQRYAAFASGVEDFLGKFTHGKGRRTTGLLDNYAPFWRWFGHMMKLGLYTLPFKYSGRFFFLQQVGQLGEMLAAQGPAQQGWQVGELDDGERAWRTQAINPYATIWSLLAMDPTQASDLTPYGSVTQQVIGGTASPIIGLFETLLSARTPEGRELYDEQGQPIQPRSAAGLEATLAYGLSRFLPGYSLWGGSGRGRPDNYVPFLNEVARNEPAWRAAGRQQPDPFWMRLSSFFGAGVNQVDHDAEHVAQLRQAPRFQTAMLARLSQQRQTDYSRGVEEANSHP